MASSTGGHIDLWATLRILERVRTSVSIRCTVRSASASGRRASPSGCARPHGPLGGDRLGLGGSEGLGGGCEFVLERREANGMVGARLQPCRLGIDVAELALEAHEPFARIADGALQLVPAGDDLGEGRRRLGEGLLQPRQCRFGRGDAGGAFGLGALRPFGCGAQARFFLRQPGDDTVGVCPERPLAGNVAVELGDAAIELRHALAGALLLAVELVTGENEPVQGRARLGGLIAQGGELMSGDCLVLGGLGLLGRALGDDAGLELNQPLGLADEVAGLPELEIGEGRLRLADIGGQAAIAHGLTGLALQPLELALDLGEHGLETVEIGLGGLQAGLGLVAAGVEAGDAGGFLEDAAARLRLGADDLADLALTDERGRAGAGGGVGEEDLHVAGAHLAAVDLVERARLALDPPRHFKDVVVVELRRGEAPAVVDGQHHLGGVAGGAVAGAGEDDVVHAGRAHVLERVLAHHPAQRLDQIRLAAAVRPDDARQARLDQEIRRLHEGLEAVNAEAGELHRAGRSVAPWVMRR